MNPNHTQIHSLELGPMENFIYLIEDRVTGRCAVVDPAWDVDAILDKANELKLQITDILLTHSHHDHINGIEGILQHNDAQLHLLKPEYEFWQAKLEKPTLHHGGDSMAVGETTINILHTPGHTPGSACYQIGDQLITGDTLFVFGCGRCDLRGGDPEQMFETLKKMKNTLDPQLLIHPGHNYSIKTSTTLKEETEGNPFMHFDKKDQFIDYRMHRHDTIRHDPYGPVTHNDLRVANLLT